MTVNMGSADRIIRAIVGVVLLALVFVGPQTPWGWIGIVPLTTALVGNCPAYSLLGIKPAKQNRPPGTRNTKARAALATLAFVVLQCRQAYCCFSAPACSAHPALPQAR